MIKDYSHQEILNSVIDTAKKDIKKSAILDFIVANKDRYKDIINFHDGNTYPISWMLIETSLDYYLKELLPIIDFKVLVYKSGKNEFRYVDFLSETIKKEQTNSFKIILEYLEESKKPYDDWCGVDVGFLGNKGNKLTTKSVLAEMLKRPPVYADRLLKLMNIDLNYKDSYDLLGLIRHKTSNFQVNINIKNLYQKLTIVSNLEEMPNNLYKMVYILGSEEKWSNFYGNKDVNLLPYLISKIESSNINKDLESISSVKFNNFKV